MLLLNLSWTSFDLLDCLSCPRIGHEEEDWVARNKARLPFSVHARDEVAVARRIDPRDGADDEVLAGRTSEDDRLHCMMTIKR